jgi:hypothetical protein
MSQQGQLENCVFVTWHYGSTSADNTLKSGKTKTLMHKVLVRLVLTYATETWTLSKTDERLFSVFERRIFRCIFEAVQENGVWRKRYNHELYELFNESDIVKDIK